MHRHHHHPNILKPIVYPTAHCDTHDCEKFVVPHVHPSHTTHHHHKLFEHVHTYPHTESHVTDVAHQHINCGPHVPMGPMGAPAPGAFPPAPGAAPTPYGPWGR
jgi:spore coat protein D